LPILHDRAGGTRAARRAVPHTRSH
jgi:hypothetical protein